MFQRHTGARLGLGLVQRMQQAWGKRPGQLGLALGFLGVERQLQHAATVPVDAPLQVFEQAPGVAEPAQNQLRKGRAVGRQLEVQHPLRVARGFLGQAGMAFQQADVPAACGEAGRRGAAGQAAADHQGAALTAQRRRAREPRFARGR